MTGPARRQVAPSPPRTPQPGWSTPAILRAFVLFLWITDVIFLATVMTGARMHQNATKTVGRDTAPSIIAAQHIKTAIAGMDIGIVNELLTKPGQGRKSDAYERRRVEATGALISAAGNITYGDRERAPLQTLALGLGSYAELAQRARDLHDRSDPQFVAAYRQAADLVDNQLYPAADTLDKANRSALDRIYDGQVWNSVAARSSVVVTGVLLLFTLFSAQSFLSRRMRRVFNVPLLLATLVAFSLLAYSVAQFREETRQLKIAKEDAFESLHVLWRARALGYEVDADQGRYLLDDARAQQYDQEFQTKAGEVKKYLDAELKNITFPGEQQAADAIVQNFNDYLRGVDEVRRLKPSSRRDSQPSHVNVAFQLFDDAMGKTLDINQRAFDAAVLHAERTLENFQIKAIAACVAIAILALLGVLPRIQEYR